MPPRSRLAVVGAGVTLLAAALAGCSDDGSSTGSDQPSPSRAAASTASPTAPTSPTAPASDLHVTDPGGDVLDSGSGKRAQASDAALTNVDVVAADLDRTDRALLVTVTYADLDLDADGQWGLSLGLRTSADSMTREVSWERGLYVDTKERYDEAGITKSSTEDSFGNPCRGLRVGKDQDAGTVRITVPNRCLGDPQWVRVVSFSTDGVPAGSDTHYQDDLFDGSAGQRWPRLTVP